jgi:hypothetical protein
MTQNDAQERPRRLSDLLGARVTTLEGREIGHINDVRLAPGQSIHGVRAELLVAGLVISDRHAGSMLGYDRRPDQGPWLVRTLVRRLHSHASYLPWTAVEHVAWDQKRVTVDPSAMQSLSRT